VTDRRSRESALWDWLTSLDDAGRAMLFAHRVSFGVNALDEKVDCYSGPGVSVDGVQGPIVQANGIAQSDST
jgi:ParB family transcriptional regulator, chromosome partitioning protein